MHYKNGAIRLLILDNPPRNSLCLNRVTHKISTLTFDSTKFEKSGSQPIAKHTCCFTYENGNDFILPCISDSGNARTLVAQDILDDNAIAYYKTVTDKHLIPPNRSNMHIRRCILIAAAFKETIKIACAAMTVVALTQSLLHTTTATVSLPNTTRICAIYKDVPFRLAPRTMLL